MMKFDFSGFNIHKCAIVNFQIQDILNGIHIWQ